MMRAASLQRQASRSQQTSMDRPEIHSIPISHRSCRPARPAAGGRRLAAASADEAHWLARWRKRTDLNRTNSQLWLRRSPSRRRRRADDAQANWLKHDHHHHLIELCQQMIGRPSQGSREPKLHTIHEEFARLGGANFSRAICYASRPATTTHERLTLSSSRSRRRRRRRFINQHLFAEPGESCKYFPSKRAPFRDPPLFLRPESCV